MSRETIARRANQELADKVEQLALVTHVLFELLQETSASPRSACAPKSPRSTYEMDMPTDD